MSTANNENAFQQSVRRREAAMLDVFSGLTMFVGAMGFTAYNYISPGDNEFARRLISEARHSPLALDSDFLLPAAMVFCAYGLVREATAYYNKPGVKKANLQGMSSSSMEFKYQKNKIKDDLLNSFKAYSYLGSSFKSMISKLDVPTIHGETLQVKSLWRDIRKAHIMLDYRTAPEFIGSTSTKITKQITRPVMGVVKLIEHSGFLSKKTEKHIRGFSELTQFAFKPENFYSKKREEQMELTGSAESDLHLSPYHKYSQGNINLLHLAALLGNDKTPLAMEIKSMDSMQDPAIQAVFKDSKDILYALKKNSKSLRKTFKSMFESLGEASQLVLNEPNDFVGSMKEWESMTGDIYKYAMEQSADINVRQLGVEAISELASKLQHGGIEKKDAMKVLETLTVISKMKFRGVAVGQDASKGPFHKLGTNADIIAKSLKETIGVTRTWPLRGLHLPAKQMDLIETPMDATPSKENYIEIHKRVTNPDTPFPSKTIIQELAIDKLVSTVEKKLKEKLKTDNPKMSDSTLDRKVDEKLNDWHQRTAISISRDIKKDTFDFSEIEDDPNADLDTICRFKPK